MGFHEKPGISSLLEGIDDVFMSLSQKHEAHHLFGLKSFHFQRLGLNFQNLKKKKKKELVLQTNLADKQQAFLKNHVNYRA